GVEVRGVRVEHGRATAVVTADGEIAGRWVVNAAGAWAGTVAALAGALPIPLVPHRRTIVVFDVPFDARAWPMVASDADQLYFAPESGGLKLSPMDEEPMEACDPQADDVAVARGFERLARLAPALVPHALRRKWAGLRTFAPDRVPVVGEDPRVRGFFWLAGQGGCGLGTGPLTAEAVAVVGDRRAAAADRVGQDHARRCHDPPAVVAREARSPAAGADAGPEEDLVRIDVAEAREPALVHEQGLDRGAAPPGQGEEGVGRERVVEWIDAGAGLGHEPRRLDHGHPAEGARVVVGEEAAVVELDHDVIVAAVGPA